MLDVIVVGAGPAGLTAALYAARTGKSVLVLEENAAGGQINYSPLVENYPGLPALPGAQLGETLAQQAQDLGAQLDWRQVTGLTPLNPGFRLDTDCGPLECRAVVIATGVTHRPLGVAGEEDLVGAGLSYCAVCDGPFCQGRPAAVVGGGDTALQEALFLSSLCSQVTLIHRRDRFRGAEGLVRRVQEKGNIRLCVDTVVQSLQSKENGVEAVLLHRDTGATETLAVDTLFAAVGQQPRNEIFLPLLKADPAGYLLAGEDCRTSLPGVFAAGDCRTKAVRQLTTAVGDGAVAGLAACQWAEDHP